MICLLTQINKNSIFEEHLSDMKGALVYSNF